MVTIFSSFVMRRAEGELPLIRVSIATVILPASIHKRVNYCKAVTGQ